MRSSLIVITLLLSSISGYASDSVWSGYAAKMCALSEWEKPWSQEASHFDHFTLELEELGGMMTRQWVIEANALQAPTASIAEMRAKQSTAELKLDTPALLDLQLCAEEIQQASIHLQKESVEGLIADRAKRTHKYLALLLGPLRDAITPSEALSLAQDFTDIQSLLEGWGLIPSVSEAFLLIEQVEALSWDEVRYVFSFVKPPFHEDPAADLDPVMNEFAKALKGEQKGVTADQALYLLVELYWRNSVEYSSIDLERKIYSLDENIRQTNVLLKRFVKEEKVKQKLQEQLKRLTERRERLTTVGAIGVRQAFELLKDKLKAQVSPGLDQLVDVTLEQVIQDARDGILWHGLTLKEGDVLLAIDSGDFGALFHSIIGLSPLIGHAILVGEASEDGISFYVQSDLEFTLQHRSLWTSPQGLIAMRPKFQTRRGFTERVIQNIGLQEVLFDTKFEWASHNASGKLTLYCSEFIHYAFETEYSASKLGRSPYDFTDNSLVGVSPQLKANLALADVDVETGYLTPDHLFHNQGMQLVGYRSPRRVPNSENSAFTMTLSSYAQRLNQDIGRLYSERHVETIGFWKKRKIDAELYLGTKLGKVPYSIKYLPQDEARYYLFQIYKVQTGMYEGLSDESAFKNENGRYKMPNEVEKMLNQKYEEEVRPALLKLFQ